MANTPRIRFKGFTDDWEQRKLLDCIQKITDFRGRTPKKLGMDWSERGYLALSALNVKDGYIDFSQDVHYGDQSLYEKWMTGNELHKGQVLFTTEAPMGNVAQVPDNRPYILSQRTLAFEVNIDLITEDFLATILRTPSVITTLTALSSGGTAKGVSQKTLATVKITIPANLYEQEKLSNMFSEINHLITLHQRKCDETKKLKKFMLQKMFPKNGEKNPEIRFAGFTDDWEQRKLGEMCSIITKQTGFDYSATIKPSLVTTREPDTYSFIQNKDFEGLNINLDTDFYIPVSVAEKYPKIILDRPSLLISISGRIGNIALYTIEEKAFIGGAVGICKLKDVDAGKTAMYELMSLEGQKYFASLIKASSHANITVEDIRNIEVLIPRDKMEIIKLNEFIDNLSKLITLHQRKCDNLKLIKKFMLQNMFPKKG